MIRELGRETISGQTPLTAGGDYTISHSIAINDYYADAQYLLVATDDYNWQGETDETNNALAIPITLNDADLVVTDFTAPQQAKVGDQITVSWTVVNDGDTTFTWSWTDELSLSTNGTFETGPSIIASVDTQDSVPLLPGQEYTITETIAIPDTIRYNHIGAAGERYLVLNTNRFQDVTESDYANNIHVVPITILPPEVDLVPTDHTLPSTVAAGDSLSFSWTVDNLGSEDARANWRRSHLHFPR